MRRNILRRAGALVLLCMASVMARAAQTPAAGEPTYVWRAELVGLDAAGKTVTVKAPVQPPVTDYVTAFKAGEKLMLTWIANAGARDAGPVLYAEKYEVVKAADLTTGYILPVEFAGADTSARTITFTVTTSEAAFQLFASIRPGQWMTIASPMRQPSVTAIVLAVEPAPGAAAFARALPPTALAADPVTSIASVPEFTRAMKAIGAVFGAANKAIPARSFDEAQAQLAAGISTMKAVATFWEARKKDDPARLADDARMKLQQLHDLLSGSQYNVNLPAVDAAAKAVGAACGACHVKYRDQDPATKAYTIKAGTL